MKQCSVCSKPLQGAVRFCPFCGEGTDPASTRARPATVAAVPLEPAPPPVPRAVPVTPAPAAPPQAGPAPAAATVTRTTPADIPPAPPRHPPAARAARKSGKGKWIAGAILLGLVVLYNVGSSDKQVAVADPCETAFDLGTKAVTAGDLAAARTHALRASAECGDSGRAKTDTLQRAIAAAEKSENACLRTFRTIDGLMQDSRPGRARAGLNELTATCSDKPAAQELRNRLEATQEAIQGALGDVRSAIDARDPAQARAALAKLAGLNRDEPNLGQLKGEVDALEAAIAKETAAAAAPEPVPSVEVIPPVAPIQRMPERAREPAATRSADSAAAQRASMASMFLRDAEQALAQRKFDAARTYVESARRVDPNNPQLDSLMQLIRERERQMLQQETTIR